MSVEYVALSFFKSNKISYYYKKPLIIFACPDCSREAQMQITNGTWECPSCHEDGTLVTLIKAFKEDVGRINRSKIFNPKQEMNEIRRIIDRLETKVDVVEQKLLVTLKNKLST